MIINQIGGGGGSLDYAIKAYTTEAALLADTPKDNTIGIVTNSAIGRHSISASEPTTIGGTAVVSGDVWVKDNFASQIIINVLDTDELNIYPLTAYQYGGTAWVMKTAKAYQNSEWKALNIYYWNNGSTGYAVTHGNNGHASDTHGEFYATVNNSGGGCAYAYETLDLTSITTLTMKLDYTLQNYSNGKFGVFQQPPTSWGTNPIAGFTGSLGTHDDYVSVMDVSQLSGTYYVGGWVYAGSTVDSYGSMTINELYGG